MDWWRRRRSDPYVVGKQDPLPIATSDREKADPVRVESKGDLFTPPAQQGSAMTSRSGPAVKPPATTTQPRRSVPPQTWVFLDETRDQTEDDAVVADLTDTLIQQAGDEWHAPGSTDDPYFRCSELLSVELTGYDQVIADRVEAEAYHAMLDAAHDLADRLRDESEDDDGW